MNIMYLRQDNKYSKGGEYMSEYRKVGYIRNISTQTIEEQFESLKKHNVDKIITEIKEKSNENHYQDNLKECIETLNTNDFLVVNSIDVLGDNTNDIVEILRQLDMKNIGLLILEIPIDDINIEDINVQKIFIRQLIYILTWINNREIEYIREGIRKRQALGVCKAKGTKGRPKKYSQFADDPNDRKIYYKVLSMLNNNVPIKQIAETTGLSRNTVYNIRNEMISNEMREAEKNDDG